MPASSLVQKRRHKRSERIITELEAIALAMFEQRGFVSVTVEEIAAEAQISTGRSTGTFPAKRMCCWSGFADGPRG